MNNNRVYNFSSGPAMLPESVLQQAQAELMNWQGTGISMLELHHRSKEFIELSEKITEDFRELLAIPKNYKILFVPGGGRGQFAMVPLNLLGNKNKADYVITGLWSRIAEAEAERYAKINIVEDAKASNYTSIREASEWLIDPEAAFLHYADNETVDGLEFDYIPDTKGVPLVSDMSSNILTRRFDVSRFAVFYACAQKNMGPAGITVAVVHEDFLDRALAITPSIFNYKKHAESGSMQNTPPCFVWYMLGLVLDWVKEQGGVPEMEKRTARRSQQVYQCIDQSQLYVNPVNPRFRSRNNIVFDLRDTNLNERFINEAAARGLVSIKGHPQRGGMRVGIYNAMPDAGVNALVEFMKDFEKTA
jgi:phosphoserine aminotransferase